MRRSLLIGQPIQGTLDNAGQLLHDFSITEGVSQPVKSLAQPGQKAVATFAREDHSRVSSNTTVGENDSDALIAELKFSNLG